MRSIPRRLLVALPVAAGLIALTHFGTPAPEDESTPSATSSPSPLATGPDARAQQAALRALDAQVIFFTDHTVYGAGAGAELEELRRAEPGLDWGREVIVVVPAAPGAQSKVAVIRAASSSGRVFCAAEVSTDQDAGTWFASVTNAPCPPVARGMPGWHEDRTVAWL